MRERLKKIIKNNIPAQLIELLFSKKVAITKTPSRKAVISDLFINRIENDWETHFELLKTDHILSPQQSNITNNLATIFFFNRNGESIGFKKVDKMTNMKNTLNISSIAKSLGIFHDGLFAIFHHEVPDWYENYNSFLAERGYVGYINPHKGNIKSFVHGNMDSIALDENKNQFLLGEISYLNKEYHLQHQMDHDKLYELFFVNNSRKIQHVTVFEKKEKSIIETKQIIYPGGFEKFIKPIYKSNDNSKIIVKSKLPLARPIVFKHMESSFDVFHG